MGEIYFEPITPERMKDYSQKVKELDKLIDRKKLILNSAAGAHGVDYSKLKVTTGNGNRTSEEERYVSALKKVDEEINHYLYKVFGVYGLLQEHEVIKTQIRRVTNADYRKILTLRYLEKWKWSEIIYEFFWMQEDFAIEEHGKYKRKMLDWHARALEELKKISEKPYVPVTKQLTIGESNKHRITLKLRILD